MEKNGTIGNVDPLSGPILKGMISYSLPVLTASLLQILFSTVDTAVIGKYGTETAMSAMGVSSSVSQLLMTFLWCMGGGVTIVMGNMFGKKDTDGIHTLQQTLPLSFFLLGAIIGIPVILLTKPILTLVKCPSSLMADASLYFRIRFIGAPLALLSQLPAYSLNAKGESLVPMLFSLGSALLNTVLDLLFVGIFHWGILGVGLATLLAEFICAAVGVAYLCRRRDELRIDLKELTLFKNMKPVFEMGIPSALEGFILNFSSVIISSFINSFDSVAIAGNTVGTSIGSIATIAFTSLSGATTVFISQNNGAGNLDRVKKAWKTSLLTSFLLTELFGAVLYLMFPVLARLFTDDPAVIAAARVCMSYMCLFYGLNAVMNIGGGCIQGMGDSRSPLILSIICSVLFRITWLYTYSRSKGTIESVYIAYPLCWLLYAVLSIIVFLYDLRKREKELSSES